MKTRTTTTRRPTDRRGYAMVMVLMFNVLFLMLLGVAYREMGSAIRMATAREQQRQRDSGIVRATARAMYMLETWGPPSSLDGSQQYKCFLHFHDEDGDRYFPITLKRTVGGAANADETWTVSVATQSSAPTGSGLEVTAGAWPDASPTGYPAYP